MVRTEFGLGTWDNGPRINEAFNGMMSDIRMYNFALSADSLQKLATNNFAAPKDFKVAGTDVDALLLLWKANTDVDSTVISMSTDSVSFKIAGYSKGNTFKISELEAGTKYFVKAAHLIDGVVGDYTSVKQAMTVHPELVSFLPLDQFKNGSSVYDSITNATDTITTTNISIVGADESGVGVPVTKFSPSLEFPLTAEYVWLYNTVKDYGQNTAYLGRTVSLWFKNESPDKDKSTIFSWGKHNGFDISIMYDSLMVITHTRIDGTPDRHAVKVTHPFTSGEWTHMAYVFDFPATKLYVNGNLVAQSSTAYWDKTKKDINLPPMLFLDDKNSGSGKNAEIGTLNYAFGGRTEFGLGTWDNGPRIDEAFNGMMSNIRLHNYALSDADIMAQYEELKPVAISSFTAKAQLELYPNPASEIINFSKEVIGNVSVFNSIGKMVMSVQLNGEKSLNISNLQKGLYIVSVEEANGIKSGVVVVR
ncbi:MAG: T9SS type A sorting domain-containing protein [Bacteroidales bacterium]|nr:T9SS type A sorting domain-containing protein [Bacteroidales bacterium]